MSKTFCILPWMHVQTKPNGQMKPCCRFDHKHAAYRNEKGPDKFDHLNINTSTFTDAINSPEWEEIRQLMIAGEKVPGCRKCYDEEEFAYNNVFKNQKRRVRSMRNKENYRWNENDQEQIQQDDVAIRYLELTMGNYCNLKCRTCTADLSSTWNEEEKILSKYYDDRREYKIFNVENTFSPEDFMNIEEIKFTGGEPMLHPNFIKIMDIIIESGRQNQIILDIFTNASWVPKEKVLSRLSQFKQVHINLSVDGVGKVNDYVRAPSKWETVEDSIKTWLKQEADNPDLYIIKWCPCISIYNVWQFGDMVSWWFTLQNEVKNVQWYNSLVYEYTTSDGRTNQHLKMQVNVVHDPKYLGPNLYPEKNVLTELLVSQKHKWINEIKALPDGDLDKWQVELNLEMIFNKVVGKLREPTNQELLEVFINYTADLDKLRNEKLQESIPEVWYAIKHLVEYKGRINEL